MNISPKLVIDEELLLRQPRKSDIDERFKLGRSLEFRKMVGGSVKNLPVYEYKNAVSLFEREISNKYSWFIEFENRMIGVCRLKLLGNDEARYSVGIYDDTLYSKGIGTKVTKTVIRYAFTELNISTIELVVLEFNRRAIKCYENCGFKQVETLKNNLEVDGELFDDIRMEIKKDKQ